MYHAILLVEGQDGNLRHAKCQSFHFHRQTFSLVGASFARGVLWHRIWFAQSGLLMVNIKRKMIKY